MNFRAGFARADLLGVLAISIFLAFLAAPAMRYARNARDATICQANMRTLARAWQLYADDQKGRFVQRYPAGNANQPRLDYKWVSGWVDWTTSPDNTNTVLLRDQYSLLGKYIIDERNVHKCPADRSLSPQQRQRGFKERVRSTVINGTVYTSSFSSVYSHAQSDADLIHPGPAKTSVFTEEHPDSINDGIIFPPDEGRWRDVPAGHHGNAATFAFADGHTELHRWRDAARNIPVRYGLGFIWTPPGKDIAWLSYHSNRRTEKFSN